MVDSSEGLEYQLRVAAEEIDVMREEIPLGNLPHIKTFLQQPFTRWLLHRIQELCWTAANIRGALSRRTPQPHPLCGLAPATSASGPSTIWLDVTNSFRSGFKGGVARVAMKLAEASLSTGAALPVVMKDGAIYSCRDVDTGAPPLRVTRDTIFVLVDTFWKPYDEYVRAFDQVKAQGGRTVVLVHDVIALDYAIFFDIAFIHAFRSRLGAILRKADACITVSGYTLRQVRAHFGEVGAALPMASFRLGADFHGRDECAGDVRAAIRDALAHPKVFISVGTLEPRKGYVVSLDAFDTLWAEGADCRLVIFGQRGWICRALERRILAHPEHGRRLFWFQDSSDAELSLAYRTAYCLIQASVVEGFGLPIVEACRENTPVIASDADIFREVGQDKLVYFRCLDSDDLARAVRSVLAERPALEPLDISSWDESLRDLVGSITTLLPARAS